MGLVRGEKTLKNVGSLGLGLGKLKEPSLLLLLVLCALPLAGKCSQTSSKSNVRESLFIPLLAGRVGADASSHHEPAEDVDESPKAPAT